METCQGEGKTLTLNQLLRERERERERERREREREMGSVRLFRPKAHYIYTFPQPLRLWAGYDTRSIFKQCTAGLNSEFSPLNQRK